MALEPEFATGPFGPALVERAIASSRLPQPPYINEYKARFGG